MNQQVFARHVFPNEAAPMWLHIRMFIPSLEQNCDEKQLQKWIPLAKSYQILGTYAQTEMGHGNLMNALYIYMYRACQVLHTFSCPLPQVRTKCCYWL